MTLEEAKKILEKEFAVISLHKSTEPFEFDESGWIEHEKPSVLEAFRVLSNGGYYISISGHDYNMREKRLKKEYEENTKAPGPCEEQPKEGNPALEESASQFNDALLDEQGKKIELAAQKDLVDDISLKYDGAKYNLKLRMDECEKLKKQLDSNTKMVQKMAEIIVHKKPVTADVFKKCCIMAYNEEKLSKVLDDVIDQFLLFGEIIIKEEK